MPNPNHEKVIIIGSAHPLRGGGISTFNECLARQFSSDGFDTTIFSYSLQYPDFLFPGKSQFADIPAPTDIKINTCINSINPLNWIKIGFVLKKLKPKIIVCLLYTSRCV